MKEVRPLLSICIPTYNRANCIGTCLDSIVSQFEDEHIKNNTEIVISDNGSTDNTTEIVKKYQEKYNNIFYFRNEKNLGFDRNVVNVIEKSKGVYCLTIGDDDAFFENSIGNILTKLENSNTPFYSLNFWGYDGELKNPILTKPNITSASDIHYQKLSDYIKSINEYTNMVGMFVGLSIQLFLRDPWIEFKNKEKFFDTQIIHMYINLITFKDKPFTIISKPTIKTRSSNIRWESFTGLEKVNNRIKETIKTTKWIMDNFNIKIPNYKIYTYFYIREYWFTLKEVIKAFLYKIGLGIIIKIYRKIR